MNWKIYSISVFPEYAQTWETLNDTHSGSPLLSLNFVTAVLDYFSSGKEKLCVCTVDQQVVAVCILQRLATGQWITLQPSQAPIGLWLQSPEFSTARLCATLMKALPGIKLMLSVTQQDPYMLPRSGSAGGLETLDYIKTARVTVSGTFKDYWEKRSKNLKQNMKRQRNRLARENIEIQMTVLADPADVPQAISSYGNLESKGWKSKSETAISSDNLQGRFYTALLTRFCEKGQGKIYQYRYNDRLVATDLCIQNKQQLIILKTTYDESIKTSSPAFLMRQESFEQLFSSGEIEFIEFYGKVMDWHTKWSDETRVMYHCNHASRLGKALRSLKR